MVTWNRGGGLPWLKFQGHLLRSTCFWASAAGATCSPLIYAGSTSWMKTGSKPKPLLRLPLSPEHLRMKSHCQQALGFLAGAWIPSLVSAPWLVSGLFLQSSCHQRPEAQLAAGWPPGTSSSLTIHVWLGPRCPEFLRMTASCSSQEPLLIDFSQFFFIMLGYFPDIAQGVGSTLEACLLQVCLALELQRGQLVRYHSTCAWTDSRGPKFKVV